MNNKWTKENFELYDSQHPDIWEMFKKFSLQVAAKRKINGVTTDVPVEVTCNPRYRIFQ